MQLRCQRCDGPAAPCEPTPTVVRSMVTHRQAPVPQGGRSRWPARPGRLGRKNSYHCMSDLDLVTPLEQLGGVDSATIEPRPVG